MAEAVNHPPHYQSASGIEAIDVIEAFGLGFHRGNAVKYLLRAGRKGDTLTDLKKAAWYLSREIDRLQGESDGRHPSGQ
jgi:rRNA processing protein Krr1/Pno1